MGLALSVMLKPEHATQLLYGFPGFANLGHSHFLRGRRGGGKNSVTWILSAFANLSSIVTVGLMCPFSIRLTVTKPTPARLASSRTISRRRRYEAGCARPEVDAGRGASGALTTEEREELGRLRRENRTLRMERVGFRAPVGGEGRMTAVTASPAVAGVSSAKSRAVVPPGDLCDSQQEHPW
jgi:hypothetical protein